MRTFAPKQNAIRAAKSASSAKPGRALAGQSAEVRSILRLQRTIGNQAVQRLLQSNAEEFEAGSAITGSTHFAHDFSRIPLHAISRAKIQSKPNVSTPGDIYEQEADRVADQLMRMPKLQLQRACPCGGECHRCQKEHGIDKHLPTEHVRASDSGQTAVPPIVHEVLATPGPPLDAATRGFMEPRFSQDFSKLRVHTDAKAAESAQVVNALAYFARVSVLAPSLVPLADGLLLAEGERLVRTQIKPRESPRLVSPDVSKAIRAACDKRCGPLVGGTSDGETECDSMSAAIRPGP